MVGWLLSFGRGVNSGPKGLRTTALWIISDWNGDKCLPFLLVEELFP